METRSTHRAAEIVCGTLAMILAMGCSSALAATTLNLGMNGGEMERIYTQHVLPPFEKANQVKVVVVPGTSAEILVTAQAEREKPRMHVMFMDDGVMDRAASMGLCEPLKPSRELFALFLTARTRDDISAGLDLGLTGLAYNTKLFKEKGWAPPTSWMDLADPKYKKRIVFQSIETSTFGLHAFLMINRGLGGTDENLSPAFDKWSATVGPNIQEYISNSSKIAEMLRNEEIAIFPITYAGVVRLKQLGLPVEYAAPEEGAVILSTHECVVANNTEPELAQKLAQYLISPQAQALALKYNGSEPSSRNIAGAGQLPEALRTATIVNWTAINKHRAEWSDQWERLIGH